MPVSSPSYFPPNRINGTIVGISAGTNTTGSRNFLGGKNAGQWTDLNDLIVIGDSAFSGGTSLAHITDTNLAGSICIGSNAGALATSSGIAGAPEALTLIGTNALAAAPVAYGVTIVGANNAPAVGNHPASPPRNLVIVGSNIAQADYTNFAQSVLIGTDIAVTAGAAFQLAHTVIIGWQACKPGPLAGQQYLSTCVVGSNTAIGLQAATNVCIIGCDSGGVGLTSATDLTAVGSNVGIQNAPTQSVSLGSQIQVNGGNSILIGFGANFLNNVYASRLVMEVQGTGAMFFGDLAHGSLIIGNSVQGTNRDFAGVGYSNIIKMLGGSVGNANPIGGGYFVLLGTNNDLNFINSNGAQLNLTGSRSSPAALAANANNWQPTGSAATLRDAREVRITTSVASVNITGLDASTAFDGQEVTLTVLETSTGNAVLTNQDVNSLASNRFVLPGLAALTLTPGSSVRLWYDATSAFWRKFA